VLPDRLEDAEGFFGLEEIEDVEVVKEAGNRHATFRVRGFCGQVSKMLNQIY
jgi:ATP-dependent RNA helicase DDX24/MAK5